MTLSDDDLLARVYAMAGSDDDNDEDTHRLRELRQTFRDMPDEDPPERGLAALMAAARVKAEEMKPAKAPWWRVFTRPPVLALASVVVLVGGAVLIGRHDATKSAVEPTATAPASSTATEQTDRKKLDELQLDKGTIGGVDGDLAKKPDVNEPAEVPSGDGKLKAGEKEQRAAQGSSSAPPTTHRGVTNTGAAEGRTSTPTPAPAPTPTDDVPRVEARPETHNDTPPPPPPAPAPPRADPRPRPDVSSSTRQTPGAANGRGAPTTAPTTTEVDTGDATAAKKDAAKSEDASETQTTRVTRGGPRTPTTDQLVKQCQVAASRGDCAAVKSIAARIQKDDAESYRTRVVKDAAIAKCLQ